jgi:LysM repeat protein
MTILQITRLLYRADTTCGEQYTIKAGDSCSSISLATGIPTELLQYVSTTAGSLDCTRLLVGQPICTFGSNTDCARTYRIAAGDTCPSIAAALGLTPAQFLLLNPGVPCSALQPGSSICVDTSSLPPGEPGYSLMLCSAAALRTRPLPQPTAS